MNKEKVKDNQGNKISFKEAMSVFEDKNSIIIGEEKSSNNKSKLVFDQPTHEIYCKNCKVTNFFYEDNELPFVCDCCKSTLLES